MMDEHGFVRIAVGHPVIEIGNPIKNRAAIEDLWYGIPAKDADIVLLPELCLSGYTCGDLFHQHSLLKSVEDQLMKLAKGTPHDYRLRVIGAPIAVNNNLYNCAVIFWADRIVGVVPKRWLPNYKEFYEGRWFRGASGEEPNTITIGEKKGIPFGTDLLFQHSEVIVGVEICEDVWMPIPPSSYQAIAGANVLLNLSASNELIGKCEYRRSLVIGQSGRCIAAYAYASSGPTESTSDLVFGGHCLIAENGVLLRESNRVGDGDFVYLRQDCMSTEVDIQRLMGERRLITSFGDCIELKGRDFRVQQLQGNSKDAKLGFITKKTTTKMRVFQRRYTGTPFVPKDPTTLQARCNEIFGIQCCGLAKRLERINQRATPYIGISGGLDSTLALMVAAKTYDMMGWNKRSIHGVTMRGFGTSKKTEFNALGLMDLMGITPSSIDIRAGVTQDLIDMRHMPFGIDLTEEQKRYEKRSGDKAGMTFYEWFQELLMELPSGSQDLVFENTQARKRTYYLMNQGFVLGTGDLSEAALGWCTYNGDHMSMYNVNCSIPKTLVSWIVRHIAENEFEGKLQEVLLDIAETVISPELLPTGKDGQINQSTEDILGPYELHDFFLYHFMRSGFGPRKILFLANLADFTVPYSEEKILSTLKTFVSRFFNNQFKRNCVPDGPKVGSVSLSPRGDWRMPSDADAQLWLDELRELEA